MLLLSLSYPPSSPSALCPTSISLLFLHNHLPSPSLWSPILFFSLSPYLSLPPPPLPPSFLSTCMRVSLSVLIQSMSGRMMGFSFGGREVRVIRVPAMQQWTRVCILWCSSCSWPRLARRLRRRESNSWLERERGGEGKRGGRRRGGGKEDRRREGEKKKRRGRKKGRSGGRRRRRRRVQGFFHIGF